MQGNEMIIHLSKSVYLIVQILIAVTETIHFVFVC